MPHLCAQVLQLFIKRPLLCQNMEIECRYSWYSQQTHQWTGSHWGALLTVTRKSHPGDCMAAGDAFLANWYPQEEHCSIWCNPVQHSWLQKTQFLHCDHVIVLYFRFKHVFFSYVSEDLWMHRLTLSVQTLQLHKWSIHEETLMVTVHSRAVAHNKPEGNVALSLPSHLCYLPRFTLSARCVTLHRAPSAFTYTAAVATHH